MAYGDGDGYKAPANGGTPSNPSSTQGQFTLTDYQTKQQSVYWGTRGTSYQGSMLVPGTTPVWYTPTQAKSMYAAFDSAALGRLATGFNNLIPGYFGSPKSMWNAAVSAASAINQTNAGQKVTPWDVIDQMQLGNISTEQLAAYSSAASGPGPRRVGSTSSDSSSSVSYSITSKSTADRMLDTVLSSYLGRTATDSEKKQFLATVNKQERATPTSRGHSSGSSVTMVGGGTTANPTPSHTSSSSSSTSTSNSGVDVQQRAIEAAQADPGYAEYQYGTTYMNAFLQSLGALATASGTV